MKATAANAKQGVTGAQMREAERGLKLMLRAKFPRVWINEHAAEVLGQANVEYQEWLEDNPPARNPVGWLLTCAYRRALNLRDSESRKPTPASLDSVFHVADEATPTPEQQALDHDRQNRLREALSHLPDKEVKLLSLVYFEDNSIREAGRKLGWQKSAADRHHGTALEKLRALVGDDRSLFSPATLGLAAYLASRGRVSRFIDAVRRSVVELARTLSPFSDAGTAAANSGVGRAVGVCGAGIVAAVCVGAATIVAPGLNGAPHAKPSPARQIKGPIRQGATAPTGALAPELPTLPSSKTTEVAGPSKPTRAEQQRSSQKQAKASRTPRATHKQVEENFGLDSGSGSSEATPEQEPESTPEAAPSSPTSSPESSPKAPTSPSKEFGL
ncbi:MAG TPA: sigma-70 family RNA polymerase sigma factor [Solirubrobacterales bacterium]|jgi:RNA polymerase sigma factor (sigma-70 family)